VESDKLTARVEALLKEMSIKDTEIETLRKQIRSVHECNEEKSVETVASVQAHESGAEIARL
jgi:predicted transcriptional regulator